MDSYEELAWLRRDLRRALKNLNGTSERITVEDIEDKIDELKSVPYHDEDQHPRPTFR